MTATLDLTGTTPRSPNHLMAGIVSLARTLDKARAENAGTLGEYHYDCPHDKPLFAFLGLDAETFKAHAIKHDDAAFAAWIDRDVLAKKSAADRTAFNEKQRSWRPDPGTDGAGFFTQLRDQVAPGRSDIVTWFDLLDLDEGRTVTHPHN